MKLEEIKEGDYVIYSEISAGKQYTYANSLNLIVDVDGVLYPKPVVVNSFPSIPEIYEKYEHIIDPNNGDLPVKDFFCERDWYPAKDYTPDMDAVEYMKKKIPLNK